MKNGAFQGFRITTTSYLNSFLLGHLFDLNKPTDKTVSLRLTDRFDRQGLDMLSFGSMLDFLITECELGNLNPARSALPITRDLNTLNLWVKAIAERKGFADILGGGWQSVLEYLGEAYAAHAPIIKNCDIIWEPRLVGLGKNEFEQIVSLKGPRSASGVSPTMFQVRQRKIYLSFPGTWIG